MNFSNKLIDWYNSNKRDLPWRRTKDPYKIWVSEIILQQTRIEQGEKYYHKFLKKYPMPEEVSSIQGDYEEDVVFSVYLALPKDQIGRAHV